VQPYHGCAVYYGFRYQVDTLMAVQSPAHGTDVMYPLEAKVILIDPCGKSSDGPGFLSRLVTRFVDGYFPPSEKRSISLGSSNLGYGPLFPFSMGLAATRLSPPACNLRVDIFARPSS
jgi:hypothetical protein